MGGEHVDHSFNPGLLAFIKFFASLLEFRGFPLAKGINNINEDFKESLGFILEVEVEFSDSGVKLQGLEEGLHLSGDSSEVTNGVDHEGDESLEIVVLSLALELDVESFSHNGFEVLLKNVNGGQLGGQVDIVAAAEIEGRDVEE